VCLISCTIDHIASLFKLKGVVFSANTYRCIKSFLPSIPWLNSGFVCESVKKMTQFVSTCNHHFYLQYIFLTPFLLLEFQRTLTAPIEMIRCLKSIKEYAFCESTYPLVITLEDHLTADLQAKVAEVKHILI
jgi:hypothetical protein